MFEVLTLRLQPPDESRSLEQKQSLIEAVREQLECLPPHLPGYHANVLGLKPIIALNSAVNAERLGSIVRANQAFSEAIAFSCQAQNNHIFYLALGGLARVQMAQGHLHAARQTHGE